MATDDELERFYAGFTRVGFTYPQPDDPSDRSDSHDVVIPRRRRRTGQRWLPIGNPQRLPPVPSYIQFDEDGNGFDSRVGRSRRKPRTLGLRNGLAHSSIRSQYRAVVAGLQEIGETSEDPIAHHQLTMTEEQLRRDARRCGLNERQLDRIRDGESPFTPHVPAVRPVPPPMSRQTGFEALRKLPNGH